ncbi:MAG: hypothetical protein HKUEN01_04250 [Candidatus Kuenenia stuttgartiensis]|nr:MAG: hypothetical protein HKUEN01_04250 [Candidatus Kuenenia stuttgartiensis]
MFVHEFIEKFQQPKLLQNGKDFLTNDKAGTDKTWREYMELRKYIHRVDGR